jgi:predicted GNAT superfamily acetyltransferase
MVCEMPAFEWVAGAIRPFLYSHLMAVDGLPVGHELKKLQRREALRRGLSTIRWTYDPLQSLNANINIRKCGATCQTYKRGVYSLVGINAGVDADRFYVTWELDQERVQGRMENGSRAWLEAQDARLRALLSATPRVNRTAVDPQEPAFRLSVEESLALEGPALALEIPINFQAMIDRACDTHAQPWRACTRRLFEAYFDRGYAVCEFVLLADDEIPGAQRAFYLLERLP